MRPANEGRGSYRPTPFGGVWFAVEDGKLVIAGPDAWDGDWLPTPRTQRGRDHCISLASVTGDVIAITARRRGARIVYRIVDEWGTAFSVVRVTTDRPVYRLRRPVRITLTETNTSDHEVAVAIGCQILHSSITRDGETVWTFHDYRVQLEPGIYVVHAGVDGVTGTATIRLRRRRASTS